MSIHRVMNLFMINCQFDKCLGKLNLNPGAHVQQGKSIRCPLVCLSVDTKMDSSSNQCTNLYLELYEEL